MSDIGLRFQQYHLENPQVWELFQRFTIEVIRAGHKHYSARAVFQRIRWHTSVETRGDDFKINDHYSSRYARMFHVKYPKFEGFFRTRELRST